MKITVSDALEARLRVSVVLSVAEPNEPLTKAITGIFEIAEGLLFLTLTTTFSDAAPQTAAGDKTAVACTSVTGV